MVEHRRWALRKFGHTCVVAISLATVLLLTGCDARKDKAAAPPVRKNMQIPFMAREGGHFALMVDGAPYLILGAQMNNWSNYPAVLPKVWPVVDKLGANTLFAPVAWEQTEPQEGKFDFTYVDTLLAQARQHRVRLVLLWFGTWKNTSPSYAPAWVKLDNDRFPRMIDATGDKSYALSPLYRSTLDADTKAFVTLMAHLKAVDPQRTVIMMQVENEPGTYRTVRDYSPVAQKLFGGPAPAELVTGLHRSPGTWSQVFGKDADEYFHAWYVARFIEHVAAAGRAMYPLPIFTNAALRDPVKYQDPATYASGGPTWNVIDIYKIAAPTLSVEAPDVYARDYPTFMAHIARYNRPDNPLFLSEIGNDKEYARYFFAILGAHGIAFTPFGMDFTGFGNYPLAAKTVDDAEIAPFAANFHMIEPLARRWAKLNFESEVWGVSEPDDHKAQSIDLGRWTAKISYRQSRFGPTRDASLPTGWPPGSTLPCGGVLIAKIGHDEYLVMGLHARVEFAVADSKSNLHTMFDRVQEGHYKNGNWVFERIWNGDQTDWGLNFASHPQLLRVKLATY